MVRKCILSVCFVLGLLGTNQQQAVGQKPELQKVILQLKWKHQFQFAGYYAAIHQGYYRELGLEVELREADPDHQPDQMVFEGKAHFGIATSQLLLMRSQGKPFVLVAPIFQHSAQVLLVRQRDRIRSLAQLAGKRLMIEEYAADITTYLADSGVLLTQCQVLPHTYSVNELVQGHVDAMTAYSTTEPALLDDLGVPYQSFRPHEGGIDFYGDVLFTSEKLMREDPDLVTRFREASLRGWRYAFEHEREIMELLVHRYDTLRPWRHLEFEVAEMRKLVLPHTVEIGYSNPQRWEAIAKVYKRRGLLNDNFSLKGLYYTDYLPTVASPNTASTPWAWLWTALGYLGWALLAIGLAWAWRYGRQLRKQIRHGEQQIDQLQAQVKQKSRFLSIIAHDLRGPLSAVGFLGQELEKETQETLAGEQQDMLVLFNQSLGNALELLDNLLSWAKNQKDTSHAYPSMVNANEVVEQSIRLLSPLAARKQIRLQTELEGLILVNADKNMLQFILRNLISNAIKFCWPKATIRVRLYPVAQGKARFEVHDTGVGMDAKQLQQLFDAHNPQSTLGTHNEKGTGLGLNMVKEFVDKNHGQIWVTSQKGQGSSFYFELPTQ